MNAAEVEKSVISTKMAKDEKPYGLKDFSRDFPQVMNSRGKVKRTTLKKKYTLREAMQLVSRSGDMVKSMKELCEETKVLFYTRGGTITVTGEAACFLVAIQ